MVTLPTAAALNDDAITEAQFQLAIGAFRDFIAATIGTDSTLYDSLSEAEADALYQPLDSDLTAIAALTTTAFGRGLLALADAAALRAEAALGTAAVKNTGTSGDAVPLLNIQNNYSKAQVSDVVTLTDAANIAWNLDDGNKFTVTLTANRTLDNPTLDAGNVGQSFEIEVVGGAFTITSFGGFFKWPDGTVPAASGTYRIYGTVSSTTALHCVIASAFA